MAGLRSTQSTPGLAGGFARQTSCGLFIKQFLEVEGEAPAVDICNAYKAQLREDSIGTQAVLLAEKESLKLSKKGREYNLNSLIDKHKAKLEKSYPNTRRYGPTYNSFATYFSKLKLLGWVEQSDTMPSLAQDRMGENASPRTFYKLTNAGIAADEAQWRNPMIARHPEYQDKTNRYKK